MSRPRMPLRLLTNGDTHAAAVAVIVVASGACVAAGVPQAWLVIFPGLQALLVIALGTWLGGKDGPDLSAAAVAQARQQGREEAAAHVRAKLGRAEPVYLDTLADELEGRA